MPGSTVFHIHGTNLTSEEYFRQIGREPGAHTRSASQSSRGSGGTGTEGHTTIVSRVVQNTGTGSRSCSNWDNLWINYVIPKSTASGGASEGLPPPGTGPPPVSGDAPLASGGATGGCGGMFHSNKTYYPTDRVGNRGQTDTVITGPMIDIVEIDMQILEVDHVLVMLISVGYP